VDRSNAVPTATEARTRLRIGALASQGDFAAHAEMLGSLGADPVEVRTSDELEGPDGLVIPGGESTTITKAIERDGLEPAIRAHAEAGRPVLGTCAGMIICDREHLGLVDATAERNAFGRQIDSFETTLDAPALGGAIDAVFIRAPRFQGLGPDVATLAVYDGEPVLVREGRLLAMTFHPELTRDSKLHAYFLTMVQTTTLTGRS